MIFRYLKVLHKAQNDRVSYIRVSGTGTRGVFDDTQGYKSECSINKTSWRKNHLYDIETEERLYLTREISPETYAKELDGVLERYIQGVYSGKRSTKEYQRFSEVVEGLNGKVERETHKKLEEKLEEANSIIRDRKRHKIFRDVISVVYSSETFEEFTQRITGNRQIYGTICNLAVNGDEVNTKDKLRVLYRWKEREDALKLYKDFEKFREYELRRSQRKQQQKIKNRGLFSKLKGIMGIR